MKVTDLEVVRGEKQEPCPYCGEPEHKTPLMCPRIAYIAVYADNQSCDIFFRDDDGPDLAA